jgi:hypothetical protein
LPDAQLDGNQDGAHPFCDSAVVLTSNPETIVNKS